MFASLLDLRQYPKWALGQDRYGGRPSLAVPPALSVASKGGIAIRASKSRLLEGHLARLLLDIAHVEIEQKRDNHIQSA